MNGDHNVSFAYAEAFHAPDPVMDAARTLSADYGVTPVSWTVAGMLEILSASAAVTAAVEVGTGVGVSSLAILRGMPSAGILTSIDVDAQRQEAARDIMSVAKVKRHRFRTITGRGEDVLPKLASGTYDLVFLDGEPLTLPQTVEQGLLLLRPGGIVAVNQALLHGAVAKPANRAPRTQAVRAMLKDLKSRSGLTAVLIPAGDGLLVLRTH